MSRTLLVTLSVLLGLTFGSCGKLGLKNKKYEGIFQSKRVLVTGEVENYNVSVTREDEGKRLVFENLLGFNFRYGAKVDNDILFFDRFPSTVNPTTIKILGSITKNELNIDDFEVYVYSTGSFEGSVEGTK